LVEKIGELFLCFFRCITAKTWDCQGEFWFCQFFFQSTFLFKCLCSS